MLPPSKAEARAGAIHPRVLPLKTAAARDATRIGNRRSRAQNESLDAPTAVRLTMRSAARTFRSVLALAACLTPLTLLGCLATTVSPTFDISQGDYARAFDASIDTLRAYRFKVDRVDAAAGVITSFPKPTSGLATPWDIEQSTPTQEVEDFLAHNSRLIRITFEPKSRGGNLAVSETASTEFNAGPMIGRVDAVVQRRYVRGWQVSPAAILQSDFTTDTVAAARGEPQQYDAPLTRDERLAARLAASIRARSTPPDSSHTP